MSKYTAPDEVLELPGHCLACNAEAVTRVFQTSIPYFKVLHLCFACPSLSDVLLSLHLSICHLHLQFPALTSSVEQSAQSHSHWSRLSKVLDVSPAGTYPLCLHAHPHPSLLGSFQDTCCTHAVTNMQAILNKAADWFCVGVCCCVPCTNRSQILTSGAPLSLDT